MSRFVPNIPQIKIERVDLDPSVALNFEAFSQAFEAHFAKGLKRIAYEGKEFWQSEAGKRLKTSREAYQKSLVVANAGDGTYRIELAGRGGTASKDQKWLAKAVEDGIPAFDMKSGLLQGRQSRVIPINPPEGRKLVTVRNTSIGWMYPGLKGIHLIDCVTTELNDTIIPKHIDAAFKAALKVLDKAP